ncbi:hypothetical protein [Luteolibacter sp. LG18]|uniref:hypothetical protein n=1 Tax=Luteolibacter sp. LG18 TaxID=2819286 RepID=UPI0030C76A57
MFPILGEDMLEDYEATATAAEKAELEEWFGVARVIPSGRTRPGPSQGHPHIAAATVFWKHVGADDPDLPVPTRERLVHARRMGLIKRFDPWESYIEPMLVAGPEQIARNPDVEFRAYLASDLEFLAGDLVEAGWEVHLMKSPSIRYSPGGFWRFLALEDAALVTMLDADRVALSDTEIERTRVMHRLGLGLWRVPGYYNHEPVNEVRYRPILGGHFGAMGGIPAKKLMQAYVWHARRGSMPLVVNLPGGRQTPLMFAKWPGYGYDEIFQLVGLYPWLVEGGTLTFVPRDSRSFFLPADIDYVNHANPNSEVAYFDG